MKRVLVSAAVLGTLFASGSARANLIRMTPAGVSVAAYAGPLDPVPIGADGFRLTFHGGGPATLVNPVMLILGVPDATVAPTLSGSGVGAVTVAVDLGDTQNRYGGTWNTTTGFAGTFDGSSVGSAYDVIGFNPQGSSSQNYPNWNGFTGLTSWNLFVYALTFTPPMDQRTHDFVEFSTSLPGGSYVIGYGCEAVGTDGKCTGEGKTEDTPFTFAGSVVVPEPGTLSLLALGGGLFLARRRRKNQ